MYSKSNGSDRGRSRGSDRPSRPADRPPTGWEPSYRRRVQVPPNYSGNAIVDGEERPLGQTDGEGDHLSDTSLYVGATHEAPQPRFDDLPRVSELGDSHRRPAAQTVADYGDGEPDVPSQDVPPSPETEPASGKESHDLPASLPVKANADNRGLFDPNHFPFGHGFGFEEILLLGLILFLLRENDGCSDRGDLDETVILLGLLLLCG